MGTRREQLDLVVSAKDRSKSALKGVIRNIGGIVLAYKALDIGTTFLKESISEAANLDATLLQVKRISEATGRSYAAVMAAMKSQTGALASSLTVATGFLKGLTTTLNVEQINQMTTAIKDASVAMGEDFNVQLPLIIKAIKQLNPAILDNIGVTVRLDKINQKIKDGYFGLSREINETTQQHAIFTEIIRQTAQFQGAENTLLTTTLGLWKQMQIKIIEAKKEFGQFLISGENGERINEFLRKMIFMIGGLTPVLAVTAESLISWAKLMASVFVDGGKIAIAFSRLLHIALIKPFTNSDSAVRNFFKLIASNLRNMLFQVETIGDLMGQLFFLDFSGMDSTVKKYKEAMRVFQLETIVTVLTIDQAIKGSVTPAWESFVAAVDKNGARLAESFGETFATTEDLVDALSALFDSAFAEIPKKAKKAAKKTTEVSGDAVKELSKTALFAAKATETGMTFAFDSFRSNLTANLFDTQGVLREVFKGMARDFITFFIDEALKALALAFVPKVVSIVTTIFDTPANDRAAMVEGQRFAGFFISGATDTFSDANLGANIVQNAVGGPAADSQSEPGQTVIFQSPITYTGFFRDARRELENLSRRSAFQVSSHSISPLQTRGIKFS